MIRLPGSPDSPLRAALKAIRRHLIYAFLFSALVNLLFIAPMLYLLQVYDRVVPTQGGTTLLFLTLVLLFALITLAGLDAMRSRLLVRSGARLDKSLTRAIFEATLARPEQSSQQFAKQAIREFDLLRQALTGPAILGLLDAPWVPVYVLVGFLVHPWIGVMSALGAAAVVFLAWRNEVATRERLRIANEAAGRAYAHYDFTIASADVVRALGMREALIAGHLRDRESMIELQSQAGLVSTRLAATSKFVRLSLQSLALGLGALLAIDGKISPGEVFASMFIVGRAMAPIDQLVGSWKVIVQARGAFDTLNDLLGNNPPSLPLTRLPAPEGKLDVEGLIVLDAERRPILKGVSFGMKPAEVLAIVGHSGAGKSTLARAISGAVLPDGGQIRFDEADHRNWEPDRLARHVGFMPQEPGLFAGSVKDNISRYRSQLGEPAESVDKDTVEAARRAGAHHMILQLPGGYDYQLGLGGRGLSAGQAQRISLARALFRSPRYVVLDEPNAHLDAEGDAQLAETLQRLKQEGTTILLIAHRLPILSIVDTILILHDGRVAAHGPADEMMRRMTPQPPAKVTKETA